jgi:hypothetical protein
MRKIKNIKVLIMVVAVNNNTMTECFSEISKRYLPNICTPINIRNKKKTEAVSE